MLPKRERLTSSRSIKGILKRKQLHYSTPLLRIVAEESGGPLSRWVVICPKKLGSAVVRNRFRRVIMAGVAIIRHNISKKCDFILFPMGRLASSREYAVQIGQAL